MNRFVARLPETVNELCLVRTGIQVRRPSAWFFARRPRSEMAAEADRACAENDGLLTRIRLPSR